ncbi:MAG: hypothetical protein U9Q07_09545 [Planctomycetota bacterium]|nr:hypothetical protein [Planctomycetota bacterium]
MCAHGKLPGIHAEPLKTTIVRFCVVVAFSIAFANIEATVVVYLRHIFHPDGFHFPMIVLGESPHWKRFLFIEIGREAATMVLILTTCWLAGRNRRQRFAYFLTIFAIWDIFYYVWLKVLIDWPATIMDWDILFLIPVTWASPVLYPVLISIVWLVWAVIILYRDWCGWSLRTTPYDWLAFGASGLIIVVSFCIVGVHITEKDFESYFYRSLFAAGLLLGILTFAKCCLRSQQKA